MDGIVTLTLTVSAAAAAAAESLSLGEDEIDESATEEEIEGTDAGVTDTGTDVIGGAETVLG